MPGLGRGGGGLVNRRTGERTDGRVIGRTDGRASGQSDGQTAERTGERVDGHCPVSKHYDSGTERLELG